MKNIYYLLLFQIFIFGCSSASQNEKDLSKIEIGMNYSQVQAIMTNKFTKTFDGNKLNQQEEVITHYYTAPFGASGDFEIWYSKKDSTVVSIYYGD